ncbi:MAG TPA: APC family permease [Acidimicrobiales bacterium]
MPAAGPPATTTSRATPSIGLIPSLAFAVGTMVGGGVFTLSGTAINEAGPAAIVAYLAAGLIMFFSALSFVAVAGRAKAGESGYAPVADILGPVWRFVAMWGFYLNGVLILAFLAVSFGDYLHDYFVGAIGPLAAGVIVLIAVAALNLGPTRLIGQAETYIVGIKIGLLIAFGIAGLTNFGDASFSPFSLHGTSGVLEMTALLFTAYTGFNVVTNMAGSLKNPERTVPVAVIGSIAMSAVIYMVVIVAMLASGVDHFGPAGVGQAAQALMGDTGAYLIAFAACLSTLSGANANLLGANEVMLKLVAQGDVPPATGRQRQGHPVISVAFIATITVVLVLVADTDDVVALANIGALVAMIVVNAAAFRLARTGWPGPGLRLPGGPIIPLIAAVSCLVQFPSLGWTRVLVGLLLMAGGLLIYGRRDEERWGGEAAEAARTAIANLDTPLARAMRSHDRVAG